MGSNADGTTASGDLTFATVTPSLTSLTGAGATISLAVACSAGAPSYTCSGPITLSSHVTTRGRSILAVAASAHAAPRATAVTTDEVVGGGTYAVASGQTASYTFTLNATGLRLLDRFYALPVTITFGGAKPLTRTITLSYATNNAFFSYNAVYNRRFTTIQDLLVTLLPPDAAVRVVCRGRGCPFAARSLAPRKGTVTLDRLLGRSRLRPGASVTIAVTSPGYIGSVAVITIRGGSQPTFQKLCMAPGASKPNRCITG